MNGGLTCCSIKVSTDDSPFFTIRLYVYCMRCDNIVIRASSIGHPEKRGVALSRSYVLCKMHVNRTRGTGNEMWQLLPAHSCSRGKSTKT